MWNCPKCAAEVDDDFEICWSCGTSIDGVEDPDFGAEPAETTADTAEPDEDLAEPPTDNEWTREKLFTVGRFRSLTEAQSIKLRLETGGVRAIIDGENAIHVTAWFTMQANPNYEVRIFERDLENARRILSS